MVSETAVTGVGSTTRVNNSELGFVGELNYPLAANARVLSWRSQCKGSWSRIYISSHQFRVRP